MRDPEDDLEPLHAIEHLVILSPQIFAIFGPWLSWLFWNDWKWRELFRQVLEPNNLLAACWVWLMGVLLSYFIRDGFENERRPRKK